MSTIALARRRISLWGVAALLASLATGIAIYSYLSWLRSQVPIAGNLVPMIVAARDLEPGTVIEGGMFEVAKHPERYLPRGALASPSSVIGKVVSVPVFAGEAITARKLGESGGLSSVVPKGMRAYSLPVTSGFGFVPGKGDRVDVIVTFPREVLGEPISITILRYKEVASVTGGADGDSGKLGSRLGIEGGTQGGMGITLYVTAEEAQRLAMAEALGRITVVLAPAAHEEEELPAPLRPADLRAR